VEAIRTPSRLHLSLIDMEGGLGRVDGGLGVALEEPGFEMGFEKSARIEGLDGDAKEIAEKVCGELGVGGVRADIKRSIPSHVGFGSKTQLYLAIAAGICKVHGVEKPVRELARIVGRGGTSGIGVAAFESGGVVLDGGHSSGKGFKPSRFSDAPVPPVLARHDFPWWLVCAWPERKGAHGELEKGIFEKNCPIPAVEVGDVSRIILMKILPALVEKDLEGFGQGVNLLQETGFKKIEVGLQGDDVQRLLRFLQEKSAGGGMSSFGSVCFGLCESESEAKSLAGGVKTRFNFSTIVTRANNEGARWL